MHCSHFLKVALGSYKLHKVAPVPVVVVPKLSEVNGHKVAAPNLGQKSSQTGPFHLLKIRV